MFPYAELRRRYGLNPDPRETNFLGSAGGFSGALLWRVETATQPLCIRRWPSEHPSPSRLQGIHRALTTACAGGLTYIPGPLQEMHGATFFRFEGHLWEVTPWLPGVAGFHAAPTAARLCSAMEALAKFHMAIAATDVSPRCPSPGIASRLSKTRALSDGQLSVLSAAAAAGKPSSLTMLAHELIGAAARLVPRCLPHLEAAAQIRVPLQLCIRDIWHDHVLFTREEVTGIVDFGAMRSDTVVGDLARLLGSFLGDHRARWQFAVEHYRRFRPLTDNEYRLLWAFDVGNVLLSGLQWVEWIFVQQRIFPDTFSIQRRMQENLRRVRCLLEHDGRHLDLRT